MKRYSILTDDLEHCIECGRYGVQLHEVFYGNNRTKSIEDGLVIPLCRELHHNGNAVGIHKDKKLCDKWHKIGQLKWQEYYNKTEEDFIDRYKKSYL